MRANTWLCAAVGVAIAVGSPVRAGNPETDVSAARIAELIAQLGDDDFDKREAASAALAKFGEPALAALLKAAGASEDAEVRLRAVSLIETIETSLPYLFNGKDLTGWRGLQECWSVRDGALVGTTEHGAIDHNTFLCSKRAFTDFELNFRVCVYGVGWEGNSGVQVRSRVVDGGKFVVAGPQCDIGEGYWGDLYGELSGGIMKQAPQAEVARVVKAGEFNDYFIRCVGRHVTIKVNGLTTVDDDFAALPESGVIAWQLQGARPMSVTFKDIRFTDLSRK
jgi:hypothetical protein